MPAAEPQIRRSPAVAFTSPQAIFTSVLLPAPLGAQEAEHFARVELQRDAGERDGLAVPLADVANLERWDGRHVGHARATNGTRQPFLALASALGLASEAALSAFFSFALSAIFASCLSAPSLAERSSSRVRRLVP